MSNSPTPLDSQPHLEVLRASPGSLSMPGPTALKTGTLTPVLCIQPAFMDILENRKRILPHAADLSKMPTTLYISFSLTRNDLMCRSRNKYHE